MTLNEAMKMQESLEYGNYVFITPKGDVYAYHMLEEILAVAGHISRGGVFEPSFRIEAAL
jgi:hypothetical protein